MSDSIFELIDRTDDFIVINKSPEVNFHDEGEQGSGLFSLVKASLNVDNLFPVHRLDKMTSGILLLAKNAAAASELSQLFANREVEKYYLAIGSKKPKKKQGLIVGDMERSRRSSWKLVNSKENPAVTQFLSAAAEPGERLLLCKPYTGRTHQIRVHCQFSGYSIVGDDKYIQSLVDDFHGMEKARLMLHARAIEFDLPDREGGSRRLRLEAEYDDRFVEALEKMGLN